MLWKPNKSKDSLILPEVVALPVPLYKSEQGKYFVGYADNLDFTGVGISAWGSLFNPYNSGVNLHINVWTATSLYGVFRAQVWFNAKLPGRPVQSELVTPSNTTLKPLPRPKVQLLSAIMVSGEPTGGVKAFVRRGEAQNTIVVQEDGRFIFPPGGSFTVFLSNPETPAESAAGRIAFGWWEEPIQPK